jgi:flagella basal body P-ring formation protein FlgA
MLGMVGASTAQAAQTSRHCWRVVQNVAARESLIRADVAVVDCPVSVADMRLHYRSEDRSFYANSDLIAGAVFLLSFRPLLPDIRRGEIVTISTTIGPVQIKRSAIALQSGSGGKSVFVRTQDGQILTVAVQP